MLYSSSLLSLYFPYDFCLSSGTDALTTFGLKFIPPSITFITCLAVTIGIYADRCVYSVCACVLYVCVCESVCVCVCERVCVYCVCESVCVVCVIFVFTFCPLFSCVCMCMHTDLVLVVLGVTTCGVWCGSSYSCSTLLCCTRALPY